MRDSQKKRHVSPLARYPRAIKYWGQAKGRLSRGPHDSSDLQTQGDPPDPKLPRPVKQKLQLSSPNTSAYSRRSSARPIAWKLGSSVNSWVAQHHGSAVRHNASSAQRQATAKPPLDSTILESEWAAICLLEIRRAQTDMGSHLWR
ncbi:hypothetical protein MRB53_011047 [Persea americana]|uniref:Uncharacterized protein n=1 Tax=Persea americana TaxID=3435 RepID=A0ACC2LTN8_PERAE|nr:hypothetical protein MRB53_011047 [Persea americana]